MPKKTGHNCALCAKLSTEEARLKSCWDDTRCHNRRHYQRNKGRINASKKLSRLKENQTIAIAPPLGTGVSIIFYRERQDAPLHAIAAEVWQADTKVLSVQPMHCFGLSPGMVVTLMEQILSSCSQEMNLELKQFSHRIELHPSLCPIAQCPLKF
jgi:hypothetical protein